MALARNAGDVAAGAGAQYAKALVVAVLVGVLLACLSAMRG